MCKQGHVTQGESMGIMQGRVALVTGGGRGIGRGISELLAAEGAAVAVNYHRDREAADETVAAITAAGGVARAYGASVSDPDETAAMIDAVVADFGSLDTLVCNAGIASRGRSVVDTDPDEMMRVVAVHAFGPHHLARVALPHLRAAAQQVGRPVRTDEPVAQALRLPAGDRNESVGHGRAPHVRPPRGGVFDGRRAYGTVFT